MSRGRTVAKMIKEISKGALNPLDLTLHDKKVICQYMRQETTATQVKIAEFLKVSRSSIIRWCNESQKYAERVFPLYETERIAKRFITRASELLERARAKGDGWLEWQIEKDLIDRLGKMGYVYYGGDPINVIQNNSTTNIIGINTPIPTEPIALNRAIEEEIECIRELQAEPTVGEGDLKF